MILKRNYKVVFVLIASFFTSTINAQNKVFDKLNQQKVSELKQLNSQQSYSLYNLEDSNKHLNYIVPFYHLKNNQNNIEIDTIAKLEYLGAFLSDIGLYKDAIETFDSLADFKYKRKLVTTNKKLEEKLDGTYNQPAFEEVFKNAKDYRIFSINEAHHIPAHRIVTYSYLKKLRNLGFKYFAMEAYFGKEQDTSFNQSLRNGAYTKDPNYANMVKYAKDLGYTLISYDYSESIDNNDRERKAFNILDSILTKDITAKMFIHVGYSHNNKIVLGDWIPMGFLLNKKYKSFALNQATLKEGSNNDWGSSRYNFIKNKRPFNEPILLFKDGKEIEKFSHNETNDFDLLTPSYFEFSNEYLKKNTNLKYRDITINSEQTKLGFLLQIYDVNEIKNDNNFSDIIPLANAFIEENKLAYKLLFPIKKKYYLIIRDNLNNIISKKIIYNK